MAKAAAVAIPDKKKGKKKKSKKKMWRNSLLGVGGLISFIVWFGMQPLQGPPQVGLCRTYAELQIRYPTTMKLTTIEQYQDAMRLFYTYIGPFGENRSRVIECRSSVDSATGMPVFSSIKIDKMPVSDEQLKAFNATIPYILQYGPNNIIPAPYSGELADLKQRD